MNFKDANDKFKTYLVLEKSLSDSSISAYLSDITQLEKYCVENLKTDDPGVISEKELSDYFQKCKEHNLTPRTLARAISSIKSFYKYLLLDGLVENNPCIDFKSPKSGRKLPVILSPDEILAMLGAIEMYKPESQRNKALITLMLDSGMTVSEAIAIKISNINFNTGYIKIDGTSKKRSRSVPIGKETKKEIKLYLKVYRDYLDISKGAEDILFLNKKGNPLSRVMIFNIIKYLAKRAKIQKNVSPHTLRHTYAHTLTVEGVNVSTIKERLGHASILTTEIYTK